MIAIVVPMLLRVVACLRGLAKAGHLRRRSELADEVGVRRTRRPTASRTAVVGVLGDERVSKVDGVVGMHLERGWRGCHEGGKVVEGEAALEAVMWTAVRKEAVQVRGE